MPLHRALVPHPDTPSGVTAIQVDIARVRPKRFELVFLILGGAKHVKLPKVGAFAQAELWKSTCFELFVRAQGQGDYYEVNQSPSGEWMAFRFTDYRAGRVDLPPGVSASGDWVRGKHVDWMVDYPYHQRMADAKRDCWMRVTVDLDGVHDLPLDTPWEIGISAVVEEKNGRKSYWALCHPDGAADFHHGDSFDLEIRPFK